MLTGNSLGLVLNILDDYRFWAVLEMTGPNAPGGVGGGGEREDEEERGGGGGGGGGGGR